MMKKHLVCFADKRFRGSQKNLILSAKSVGNFDFVHDFSPFDLEQDFLLSHDETLSVKRGCGLWAWKPYIILKAMKLADPGDFIFYADSGSTFMSSVEPVMERLKTNQKAIGVFEICDRNEYQYTKGYVFDALNCNEAEYVYSKQIMATYQCCFNLPEAKEFYQKLLELYSDKKLLDYTGSFSSKNFIGFIEHRSDQSVLSLLAKKSDQVLKMNDPSQWGNSVRTENKQSIPEILWSHRKSSITGVRLLLHKIFRRIPRTLNFLYSLIFGRRLNKMFRSRSVSIVQELLGKDPRLYSIIGTMYHYLSFLFMYLNLKVTNPKVRILLNGGGNTNAQYGQDYFLINNGMIPEYNGVYLEVGANDPILNSNTYWLSSKRNYRGISLDPLPGLSEKWAEMRPNSNFMNIAVSDIEGEAEFLMVDGDQGWEHQLSGLKGTSSIDSGFYVQEIPISTIKLSSIINDYLEHSTIDVLFIDVEGHEINVLQSNDWQKNRPSFIVIENGQTNKNRKKVRDFLSQNGYKLIARIWLCEDVFKDVM